MLNQYRYSVNLRYIYNNKEIEFDNTNIHYIMIDYDYDNKNMPVIFITTSIDKNILDDMILNSKTKTLTLQISKFINNSQFKLKEDYIRAQFTYFLPNNLNYDKSLDYSKDTSNSTDIYRRVTIGLVMKELVDNNKRVIVNDVFTGSLTGAILYYMQHMPLLLEPTNDVYLDNHIIPPINSISKLVHYLDDNFNLYNNKYRLFYDFNLTYLLSSNGKAVQHIDEQLNTVIINVDDTIQDESKVQGMDVQNNAYLINIDSKNIDYKEDKATDITMTGIMTIDSSGNYSVSGDSYKTKIVRTTNDNINKGHIEKTQIDNMSFIITVLKTELDSSVLTINKNYIIKNYAPLKDKDGNYLLARKREVYTPDDGNFILSTFMYFRKAIS